MDAFVILTPILLLAVIALLGFVGCDRFYGLENSGTFPVHHVQTTVKTADAGTDSITAQLPNLQGGELLIATVQWRSGSVQQPAPALTGGNFTAVPGGGPLDWNSMRIQTFIATNPPNSTSVTVEVILAGGSNITWNLAVSAYRSFDPQVPVYSPEPSDKTFIGTELAAPGITVGAGDMVYAIAFAADNDGTFPGNNPISAGPDFTAEFTDISNPLVEDGVSSNPVIAQATVNPQTPNPRAFIFALGIKAKPNE